MTLKVLVVNAGSSSLKLRLLDGESLTASADLAPDDDVRAAIADWPAPDVVAHRVVHGGTRYRSAVRLTPEVERDLDTLTDLAPLHQPKSLAGIASVRAALPDLPEVACFDTAFHSSIPTAAITYAIPAQWREAYGARRYGFHGLSHAYIARRAAELVPDGRRVVSCHLGAGASLCAIQDGRSVDTTMGFTPLEGLVMATRSGSVDPGLVLWLEEHEGLSPREVAEALEHRSGLLALAGTSDMRQVEARAITDDAAARLALDVYLHRLVASVAAMAAAMEGLDVLVFTGGVGEHSPLVRSRTVERLRWLGARLDEETNDVATADADLSASGATVRTLAVEAREDLQVALETEALLTR